MDDMLKRATTDHLDPRSTPPEGLAARPKPSHHVTPRAAVPPLVTIGTCVRPDNRIGVPTAQWVMATLLGWQAQMPDIPLAWDVCLGNYIDAQRNWLVERHRDSAEILMLDSDVAPPAGALGLMLELSKPVVVAPCPIVLNGRECWNIDVDGEYVAELPAGPVKIRRGGTACMLINTAVFGTIAWPWFKTEIRRATVDDPELCARTDDEFFCDACREAGIEIWVHPGAACRHPV